MAERLKKGSVVVVVVVVVVNAPCKWLFGLTFFVVKHFHKSVYPRQRATLKIEMLSEK